MDDLDARMETRLQALEGEFAKGREELGRLRRRQQEIESTMLRLNGAIRVIRELRGKDGVTAAPQALPKVAAVE